MRKNSYSVFNNFNKNYNTSPFDPNYYDDYTTEFAEELFENDYSHEHGVANKAFMNSGNSTTKSGTSAIKPGPGNQRGFNDQPRNGY